MKPQKLWPLLLVIAIALVVYAVPELSGDDLSGNGGSDLSTDPGVATNLDGIPPISVNDLPVEALDTIDLIETGGPFPFDRDDLVFQNREGLLPDEARGYYREYTVITPGENHRGARRIVAGEDGQLYYTSDHYGSFAEIFFG